MRQSISTKYVGPTNTRGSRVIATSASGHRMIVEWDDAINIDANHEAAAFALVSKLQWCGSWVGGATKDGFCFVCTDGNGFTI